MSTSTTTHTGDVGADVFGGIFTPRAVTTEEATNAVLQPPVTRLQQMAEQAEEAAQRAHAKAAEQFAVAEANRRLAAGYRKAIDYLRAGLPSTDDVHDAATADEQP